MSIAFKNCTPFIIINMGGEMIYILDQRLQAQSISQEKATKVLSDVTQSLFTEDFVNQLFDPSPLVSLQFCKQMFAKIAHCSIMKLNEVSMGKLLDLMIMGIKYYLIASSNPTEIFHITLNHFNEILLLIKHSLIVSIVEKARDKFIATYSQCNLLDYILIRQKLLSFLQEKMVKISVFLQEGLQNNDGSLKISTIGEGAPLVEEPGNILFFDKQGKVIKKSVIDIKSAKGFLKNAFINYLDPQLNYSKLGFNLYSKKNSRSQQQQTAAQQLFQENQSIDYNNINQTLSRISAKNSQFQSTIASQLAQKENKELNALSSILKGNQKQDDNDEILIDFGFGSSSIIPNKADSLNLYSDQANPDIQQQQYQANKSTNLQSKMKEYFQDVEDKNDKDQQDNLLDLMDNL